MSAPVASLPRTYRRTFAADAERIADRRRALASCTREEITALATNVRTSSVASGSLDRVESFALACRAAELALGISPFEVQVLAGLALSYGALAEVRTGEGKTLVATLPAVCFALAGRQVHVMTANQYLAARDAEWMRPVYELLGLTVGAVDDHPSKWRRRTAYGCDLVYGTASQFGFDYLQDHLISAASLRCQHRREVALLDEADALLLDDARTPLVISGVPAGTEDLERVARFVATLPESAVDVDLSERVAMLNDEGFDLAEAFFSRDDLTADLRLMADLYASLRARFCFRRDKEYLVRDDQVLIVDESTGRVQADRRWQHGLHEAIEAKEGVSVRRSAPTLGSITVPALLALYDHVGAMTGTALSDKAEFNDVYGLHVISIPTNKPSLRVDAEDVLYATSAEKFAALVDDVCVRHGKGQPVLIGAPTVADAETISSRLSAAGVPHEVLSARDPAREAEIIAQAGRLGAVTVATNMAGRGVDILLGGDPVRLAASLGEPLDEVRRRLDAERDAVFELGGLAVLGTARHTSRRIDDQLRGRSGRQGEPGFSKFYLSLDDELLSIYASDLVKQMVAHASRREGPLTGKMVSRLIATAQGKTESLHRESRRSTNEFAAPTIAQQTTLYAWRDELLDVDARTAVLAFLRPAWRIQATSTSKSFAAQSRVVRPDVVSSTDSVEFDAAAASIFEPVDAPFVAFDTDAVVDPAHLAAFGHADTPDWLDASALESIAALPDPTAITTLAEACLEGFLLRNAAVPVDLCEMLRAAALAKLDAGWYEHLEVLEAAKSASQLRATAQLRPTAEFIRESAALFQAYTEQVFLDFAQLVSMGTVAKQPTPV
jgi:preprotein translocase subunit SecA